MEVTMLTFLAKLTIKRGREDEFARIIREAVPKVRTEPGYHAYILHRSKDNPRMFMAYEQYTDQAALDAHRAHLKEMGIDIASFIDGEVVREFYDLL
jgi:quinol monooxygenase YgiN